MIDNQLAVGILLLVIGATLGVYFTARYAERRERFIMSEIRKINQRIESTLNEHETQTR